MSSYTYKISHLRIPGRGSGGQTSNGGMASLPPFFSTALVPITVTAVGNQHSIWSMPINGNTSSPVAIYLNDWLFTHHNNYKITPNNLGTGRVT